MQRKMVRILDVNIDSFTTAEALDRCREFLAESRLHQIVTPGPEFLLEATAHPKFREILNHADLSLADGSGLHLGARLSGQKLRQRIPGADFVDHLMGLAAEREERVFLFGGKPGVTERAAATLLYQHPNLRIVGCESGQRGQWVPVANHRLIERIRLARPSILLVALGAPKQELWIDQHRQQLPSVRIAMGVGRTFDYLAGDIQRAPKFFRRSGLEWLHTYLNAHRYYQPAQRRQRVTNATYHYLIALLRHRRVPHH